MLERWLSRGPFRAGIAFWTLAAMGAPVVLMPTLFYGLGPGRLGWMPPFTDLLWHALWIGIALFVGWVGWLASGRRIAVGRFLSVPLLLFGVVALVDMAWEAPADEGVSLTGVESALVALREARRAGHDGPGMSPAELRARAALEDALRAVTRMGGDEAAVAEALLHRSTTCAPLLNRCVVATSELLEEGIITREALSSRQSIAARRALIARAIEAHFPLAMAISGQVEAEMAILARRGMSPREVALVREKFEEGVSAPDRLHGMSRGVRALREADRVLAELDASWGSWRVLPGSHPIALVGLEPAAAPRHAEALQRVAEAELAWQSLSVRPTRRPSAAP